MSLLLEEETRILRRCFFDVQNEVGVGREEEDYHQAINIWLRGNEVPFSSKRPHSLTLYGHQAHRLFPDLVAWGQITIELKSLSRTPGSAEYVQLFDYLKFRGDRLGLLVNMGLDRVHVQRILYQPEAPVLKEDWTYWSGEIDGPAHQVGTAIRGVLRDIFREHKTGYGYEPLRKLLLFALQYHGLSFVENPDAKSFFGGIELRKSRIECLVVEEMIVLCYSALFDDNVFNMNRARSYMKALDLKWGVAVNYGKSHAEINGLRLRDGRAS